MVDRAVHLDQPVGAGAQLRVVAGRDRVEAQGERPVEHRGELDLLVAAQARVGRAAGGVLVHEVLDHVLVEALAQVPDVERDADHVGRAARVVASSIVQQPRAPERYDSGLRDSARWMPVTSWPASTARAAATAESTPPDMAATTFIGLTGVRRPGALDDRADRLDEGVDVGLGGGVAEREAQRVPRGLLVAAHREQHVGGLRHAGRAGRPGRALDAAGVEQHQQRVALAAGEAEVGVAGQPVRRPVDGVTVQVRVGHDLDAPGGPGRRAARRPARRARPGALTASSTAAAKPAIAGHVEGAGADVALLAAAVQQRRHVELAAHDERADAVGAADLVRR